MYTSDLSSYIYDTHTVLMAYFSLKTLRGFMEKPCGVWRTLRHAVVLFKSMKTVVKTKN